MNNTGNSFNTNYEDIVSAVDNLGPEDFSNCLRLF